MLIKNLMKVRIAAAVAFIAFCLIVGSLALYYGW